MSKFQIHAGDVPAGDGLGRIIPKPLFGKKPHGRQFLLPKPDGGLGYGEELWPSDFAEIEIASEESVKRLGGTVGWGIAGAALLGPVGLLAGLLMGGKKEEVTFVAKLNDGRRMLGTMEKKDYNMILQAIMSHQFQAKTVDKPTVDSDNPIIASGSVISSSAAQPNNKRKSVIIWYVLSGLSALVALGCLVDEKGVSIVGGTISVVLSGLFFYIGRKNSKIN